jgi:hypothetical protein
MAFKSLFLSLISFIMDSQMSIFPLPNSSFILVSCYGFFVMKESNLFWNSSSEIHFLEGEYVVLLPTAIFSSPFPSFDELAS